MKETRKIIINNLEYVVYSFKYSIVKVKNTEVFFLLENKNIKVKHSKTGEIYIRVPSWVEMQDLTQSSCKLNMMTKEYDLDEDLYRDNKIKKFCFKISDEDGNMYQMSDSFFKNLIPIFAQFLLEIIDEVIGIYYAGTGLTREERDKLTYDCFKYYSSIYKRGAGKKITIPPVPVPILLMNICKMFNCTPDVARKISKRDIDMTVIAKEQEHICKNPGFIGGLR